MIGIGVDLCDVDRMRVVLERTPSLRERLFTSRERDYCDARRDPAERYAARFAAKEAVLKAMGLGVGACKWAEIEVVRHDSGAPSLRLHGGARVLADERDISRWLLTMSHTSHVAEAIAVAL